MADTHSPMPTRVDCSMPCLVAIYNKGSKTDGVATDFFMMPVPSIAQFVQNVNFNTFITGNKEFKYRTLFNH